MAGVQGTGQTTNNLYIGTDSANVIGAAFPPEPRLIANFSLDPTNGLASVPLPLSVALVFASDGTLQPEASVSIFVAK